jgi:hypothetical protein
MSDIVPIGFSVIVNVFRVGTNELAGSFMLEVEEVMLAADFAGNVHGKACDLITSAAPAGTLQVITINTLDPSGRGGCSWQCLRVSREVERDRFAAVVGNMAAQMAMHAVTSHLQDDRPTEPPRVVN